jgi:hypothetical protein
MDHHKLSFPEVIDPAGAVRRRNLSDSRRSLSTGP